MGTRKSSLWSELPMDVLGNLLERLSYFDFHMAKMVCSNWYLCSKQTLRPKFGSPLLFLSLEEGGCRLYSPEEDKFYETNGDFSGYRFLASSGKWFLVVDSRSDLYIVHVFSEERIRLPPLESIKGGLFKVERADNNIIEARFVSDNSVVIRQTTQDLRGLLWVDNKTGDYVVVWQFDNIEYLGFCKRGDVHYREITTRIGVPREFQGQRDMVLKGYTLYVLTPRDYIRHLDLSRQDGFEDVSGIPRFPLWIPCPSPDEIQRFRRKLISRNDNIAVASSGELLYVHTRAYDESSSERHRIFHVYKRHPKDLDPAAEPCMRRLVELDSLGDEAMFLDLGITLPADHALGIEPNSIYFTRDDRIRHKEPLSCLDICVYNLATKTARRFPSLSNIKLKDAHWFLPS